MNILNEVVNVCSDVISYTDIKLDLFHIHMWIYKKILDKDYDWLNNFNKTNKYIKSNYLYISTLFCNIEYNYDIFLECLSHSILQKEIKSYLLLTSLYKFDYYDLIKCIDKIKITKILPEKILNKFLNVKSTRNIKLITKDIYLNEKNYDVIDTDIVKINITDSSVYSITNSLNNKKILQNYGYYTSKTGFIIDINDIENYSVLYIIKLKDNLINDSNIICATIVINRPNGIILKKN